MHKNIGCRDAENRGVECFINFMIVFTNSVKLQRTAGRPGIAQRYHVTLNTLDPCEQEFSHY